ncbi:MAG: hypothetical protein KJ061_21030 [Vicinamibacteraceae bacterium]|nr:hypothetical protein [Vicinamibacteraceae bacterium]
MAPIAVDLAAGLGASADPFLMAVAIGASSAFLTPIGHQSNTLVMTPGGYGVGSIFSFCDGGKSRGRELFFAYSADEK